MDEGGACGVSGEGKGYDGGSGGTGTVEKGNVGGDGDNPLGVDTVGLGEGGGVGEEGRDFTATREDEREWDLYGGTTTCCSGCEPSIPSLSLSMSRSALFSASFSRRLSLNSSCNSASLIRSVTTILFASSNKACERDSTSSSRAAFSCLAALCAARSRSSCAVRSSSSLLKCEGKEGRDDDVK